MDVAQKQPLPAPDGPRPARQELSGQVGEAALGQQVCGEPQREGEGAGHCGDIKLPCELPGMEGPGSAEPESRAGG